MIKIYHIFNNSIYQYRISLICLSSKKTTVQNNDFWWCPEFFFFLISFNNLLFFHLNSCPKYHIWGQTENTDSQRTESMIEPKKPDYYYVLSLIFWYIIGINVRILKIDFNTGGTWRRVKQWALIMTIYDYLISLCHLVAKHVQSWKNLPSLQRLQL